MEKWKEFELSKEEEEGITAEVEEACEDEVFHRTLAARLWTDSPFNSRAFTSTMLGAWKLKNPVEVQELSKNLFLFRFATKRDLEEVLKNGPWSFDRNIMVLARVSGEEQPTELNMQYGSFWVRVYELPLMLRSEVMAKKLGGILGEYEEMDQKEAHRNGRFMRIKVKIDLKKALKRGTVVRFKEKNLRVHFKYKRLPTFCFVCGRIGHQMKDCEEVGYQSDEGYENLEEQDLSYGAWLRVSPLPRIQEEQKRKESNSNSCSKSLFNISSGQSRCEVKGKEKEGDEGEVNQKKKADALIECEKEVDLKQPECPPKRNTLEIEAMTKSFGAVDISNVGQSSKKNQMEGLTKKKKWTRRQGIRKSSQSEEKKKKIEVEMGKRNLVDVIIIDGTLEEHGIIEKKLKGPEEQQKSVSKLPEVVLEGQNRLDQ
ncbi:uncharacterized protein LOC131598472 [Vicia villosa]|uniref:uncharacterized protein LOC131598472 n=1 Tax=Vicia villosa TaxID=3911 RepID=UPI00273AAA80|nr:uncharacterized protein LOC131598472 [Vicia villosa]